jgi:hypothetical protein
MCQVLRGGVEGRHNVRFGDELLVESDSLINFFDLFGVELQNVTRLISDGKLRDGIRDKLTLVTAICAGFAGGGVTQFLTEQPTAMVRGVEVQKFPNGIDIKEEFVEGGIPISGGIILGELVYKTLVARGMKEDPRAREMLWVSGGIMGYIGMFFARDILHQILNVPDVDLAKILGL